MPLISIRLTVTNVVFEYSSLENDYFEENRLTVTNVVFESFD